MSTPQDTRERITIVSKNDLEVSYFCGPGPGGQARNKVASGVLIRHKQSGAIGRASDSRSQQDNKMSAFRRLREHPKFKVWLNRKLFEIRERETLEQSVDRETTPDTLKIEIKNERGQWEEAPAGHFDTQAAKSEP